MGTGSAMSDLAIAHRRSVINPLLPLPVPTLYFAYGSNMVSRQMALRCPRSPAIGIARLPDWRFRINAEGWATVVPEPGAVVYGRLWQLTSEDEVALDLYEALPSGLYAKQRVPVVLDGDATANAMVYLASDPDQPCGMVAQVAANPSRGWDAIVSLQISATQGEALHAGGPGGPFIELQALPYPLLDDI